MIKLKKILCPVDFSKHSLEALKYATHLVLKDDAKLYLIHIIDNRVYDYGGPIYEQETSVMKANIDQSTKERLENKLLAEVPKEIRNHEKKTSDSS
ncbi:MAG: putative universal stress protein [Candidatus Scalindua rubra]|uniref:Putative universal stress protein n=1 Tax=Candidatus Scalindua rubra TaxID=1872076 RepID=A0A1E3X730_9BACT|nr:MAG: putative universal stress protein [Candidatus Scalindua rubra]